MQNKLTFRAGLALAAFFLFASGKTNAQSLPDQMTYSPDNHRLTTGGVPLSGFYDEAVVNTIELFFDQSNYWTQLTNNYQNGTDLAAVCVINGDTLASEIGVRFKGTTSYFQIQNSQKKSFNLTLDFTDPNQDYDGYQTLNLNNCFQDPSFLREVLFYHQARHHIPIANANYAHLFINGQNWGIYPSVQQLNGDFFKEWFMSNEGTSWRAIKPGGFGGPGGGGNPFGTGSSTLNWLGTDTSDYQDFYTLKRATKEQPWDDLVAVCDVLNNTPLAELEAAANEVFDVDRALWFLAHEIIFSDDDSYVYKGGMDYYLYYEPETGRMVPQEYDANSCMTLEMADWSPFYRANDPDFVLMNRFMAVPALRQRYLAHVRTIIAESLEQGSFDAQIDTYFNLIDAEVEADNKKIYSYNQFLSAKEELKEFAETRRNFLLNNAEVAQVGATISNVVFAAGNDPFSLPDANQTVLVTANVASGTGISKVTLYHGTGFVGKFESTEMFDDGAHGDEAANDGVFGADLPGYGNGTYVRFYIAAAANNTPKSVSYEPAGAEHDVFVYRVNVSGAIVTDIVINEIMAKNASTVADQDGQFDDWIELYNKSADPVDLTGWFLSDKPDNLMKWAFPAGTTIAGNDYLIVWTDENGLQVGLHANFKLLGDGEDLYLTTADLEVAQALEFGAQQTDVAFARVPNGTGDFVFQAHTYNANNDEPLAAGETAAGTGFTVYPNPATQQFFVETAVETPLGLTVFNLLGQVMVQREFSKNTTIDVSGWTPGIYGVQLGGAVQKLTVER